MNKLFLSVLIFALSFSLSASTTSSKSNPIKGISSSIVNQKGDSVKDLKLEEKDYVAVYYSASWCPPCRQFTPVLDKFYNENKIEGNFEILLVGFDRSEDKMLEYLSHMSFNAVDFKKADKSGLKNFCGRGIPCLTVFNKSGEVVIDGRKLHASEALKAFEKLLKK